MRKGLWTRKSYRRAETWTSIGQIVMFIFVPFIMIGWMFEAIGVGAFHLIKKIGGEFDKHRNNNTRLPNRFP
jgi:hypothetical protein